MNILETRIVLICRKQPIQAKLIWRKLWDYGIQRSKNYILDVCSALADKGYLVKRAVSQGNIRGRPTFYIATSEGIAEAMKVIDQLIESSRKSEISSNIANLTAYSR